MWDRFEALEARYESLNRQLSEPAVQANSQSFRELSKEHFELSEVVGRYREYKLLVRRREEAEHLAATEKDPEMVAMASQEMAACDREKVRLEEELKKLLLPKDPNDSKDILIEIRAGAGGDEASLFAAELLRMYTRFAEARRWKVEMMSASHSEVGGFKEVIVAIRGKGVYSVLKFEGGVHRVQRVPATEANGRIHTSTVTVVVMPELEEKEIKINEGDLKWDVFCSSGAGGQSVNTTYSAVRLTHLPSGLVVSMQDERSQLKNRGKALKVMASRLQALEEERATTALSQDRKSQVGTGDRSEKIRTYNFPQNRVTDHRIGLSIHNLEAVVNGDLDELVEKLMEREQADKLASLAPV